MKALTKKIVRAFYVLLLLNSITMHLKSIILFFTLTFYNMNANSQQDLRPNRTMLENTFPIFNNGEFATCFTVNYNGQEYLITAKHLFKNIAKSGDSSSFKIVAYNKEIAITSNVFFIQLTKLISQ